MMCLTSPRAGVGLLLLLLFCSSLSPCVHADPLSAEEFTRVTAQLQDKDPAVRVAAVAKLGRNQKTVDLLFPLLQDDSPNVRAAACGVLGLTCDVRVLEPLRMMLEDDNALVRAAAAHALGGLAQLGNWVHNLPERWEVAYFNSRYADADTSTKMQAVFQQVGWEQTHTALVKLLADHDPLVRVNAAVSLQQFRDERAQPYLAEAMTVADPQLRAEVLSGLIAKRKPEVVDTALTLLTNEKNPQTLTALVRLLGTSNDQRAVDPLIAALPKQDVKMRPVFLLALGWLGDARAFDTIVSYREDPDPQVRGMVATALQWLHDDQGVEYLLKMMEDSDQSVQQCAVQGLWAYRDPRIVKRLLAILPDPHFARSRYQIINVLAVNASPAIVDPILKYQDEPRLRGVIFRALVACVNLNDQHAAQVLLTALHNPDSDVQHDALAALPLCDRPHMASLLAPLLHDEDERIRRGVVAILQVNGDNAIADALIFALKDTDDIVRCDAAAGLARLKEKRAITPLITALRKSAADHRLPLVDALKTISGKDFGEDTGRWQQWWAGEK